VTVITKWVTNHKYWDAGEIRLERVEVEKESRTHVWENGRQRQKTNAYCIYHDTWDEAWRFLIEKYKEHLAFNQQVVLNAQKDLQRVSRMKRPKSVK
jgi:DNA-binding transcriptional regulator PaaX